MAELTQLETKLAEVIGLAQAAQGATQKVKGLVGDEQVSQVLQRMTDEAAEAARRGTELAANLDGKKTAIEEKARETKQEAQEMMTTYLGDDADALDGFEFLIMAEAGELGHVEIARVLNEQVGDPNVQEVLDWNLEVQQRHMQDTRECALRLAREEDATETE